jgi:hypothetical protein
MNCPICDEVISRVIASRPDTVESQLRQRRCTSCNHTWWTCEVELPLGAVKPHQPTTESVTFAMLPTPPVTRHIPAAHSNRHADAVHAMRLHWLRHGTEPPLCVRVDS